MLFYAIGYALHDVSPALELVFWTLGQDTARIKNFNACQHKEVTMTCYFISRHPSASLWLAQQGIHVDQHLPHLDAVELQPGDRVIGTLPLQLAARVCEQGAYYWHLTLEVPRHLRGQELSVAQMENCRARLERFHVVLCNDTTCA